jgi:hypothetical protein
MRRVNTFLAVRGSLDITPFTGNLVAVTRLGKTDIIGSIDFSIAHSINIFGEVSNAADSIAIDGISTSML